MVSSVIVSTWGGSESAPFEQDTSAIATTTRSHRGTPPL
jgi:hypothetical protein